MQEVALPCVGEATVVSQGEVQFFGENLITLILMSATAARIYFLALLGIVFSSGSFQSCLSCCSCYISRLHPQPSGSASGSTRPQKRTNSLPPGGPRPKASPHTTQTAQFIPRTAAQSWKVSVSQQCLCSGPPRGCPMESERNLQFTFGNERGIRK